MPHIAEERQDNVNGVVIGGNYMGWQIFYDGRPQGGKQYASGDGEALTMAEAEIDRLMHSYSGYPCYCYPDKSKWEVRLWP